MIAKITYGADVAGCAEYDIDKAKDAGVILANELPLTTNIEQIQTLFNIQASLSSRVEKPVMHIALSFSPADGPRLENSPQMARIIIEAYLHRMGLDDAQFIATQHPHFHILVNRVFADGHVYKTGFERSRSVKACRAITEMYGLTMGEGRSNINEHALKEPDRSRQMLYREISHALKYSNSSREFWNRLRSAGVDAHPKFKNGKVVGYSFKMDGTCRMSGGKISRDFTRGNLMNVLREKDQSVSERPRLTLVIPSYNEEQKENEIGLTRHMDDDFSVNLDDFGVNNTFPGFGSPIDAPSMEQDIRKKEEEKKRRKRGMRMLFPIPFPSLIFFSPGFFTGPVEEEMTRSLGKESRKYLIINNRSCVQERKVSCRKDFIANRKVYG